MLYLIYIFYIDIYRYVGQIGYIITGMKNSDNAQIGETFCHVELPVSPLEGFKPANPMVKK
jgi:translation elongation factor EF-4